MATTNKCARLIRAAFDLKKFGKLEAAKKTLLRAMEAEDTEALIDSIDNAEDEVDTTAEDVVDENEVIDENEIVDASDDEDDEDVEEMTDDEVIEEVEAAVKKLKASAKKAPRKFL